MSACYSVSRVLFKFKIQDLHWIRDLQIFSSCLWLAFSVFNDVLEFLNFEVQFINFSFIYRLCFQSDSLETFSLFKLLNIFLLSSKIFIVLTLALRFVIVLFFNIFLINLFFNWRMIALQSFVVFCQTSTRISHRYPHVLSLPSRPHPTRVDCNRF